MDEEVLRGGVANEGRVVRIGDSVYRPAGPYAGSIHKYLSMLNAGGFDGVPSPVGFDEFEREVLSFIDGDVAVPPYPDWAQSDSALVSVSLLMSRLHAASRDFEVSGLRFSDELVDPRGGPVMCHNDVCLENVVFRNGVAVGLVDFDYLAPGRAVYDMAQFAKMCVPLDRPENLGTLGWNDPDQMTRLRLIADGYGLSTNERVEFIVAIDDAIAVGEAFVARHFHNGEAGFVAMVNCNGGLARWAQQRTWWSDNASMFEADLIASR